MKEAKEILNNLIIPGGLNLDGTLVFCDDSDIAGQPNPNLAPDIRVLCAIQINQSKYGVVRHNLLQLLQGRELHTTDMVSGKNSWAGVALQARENALNQVKNLISKNFDKIFYCHVTKGEYSELRKKAEKYSPVNAKWTTGLKRVFFRTLFDVLKGSQLPITLVIDQIKPLQEPKFDLSYSESILAGGAPIIADSSSIQGLQVADFAVWSITRYVRNRKKFGEGINSQFDNISAEFLAEMSGRIEHLLSTKSKKP